MNSVVATTYSAVYLAVRHIFPDTPLNAGAFEPLHDRAAVGTFLDARYPRPVSGCAAEVSQRIAEAVFLALVQAIPDKVTAAPAGSSGNFALGGVDPARGTGYVMYQISGGGYGGNVAARRPDQRLLDDRHLKDRAGRGDGAVLPGALPPLRACAKAQAGPGGIAAGSACTTRWRSGAGRRAPPSSWTTGASARPACRAAWTARPTSCASIAAGEILIPEHLSKDQDIALAGR